MEEAFILWGIRTETQWWGKWATWHQGPGKEEQAAIPSYGASS